MMTLHLLFPFIFLGFARIKGFQQWLYSNTEILPLIPAIFIVGGFILFTLSYVSWRKYRAEREKIKQINDKSVD